MAINDSSAPNNIATTGRLSIGSTAGVSRSINLCRNIKQSTSGTAEGSMDRLRNWFNDYVGSDGGFSGDGSGGDEVSISDWRGARITGFRVRTRNETANPGYDDNNDAKLTCQGYFDNKTSTKFKLAGGGYNKTLTAQHGASVTFTKINGDIGSDMTLTITNSLNNAATMKFRPKRSGTPYMKSTTTVGRTSASGSTVQYDFNNSATGSLSNNLYFTFGLQTSDSQRAYGSGFTYP